MMAHKVSSLVFVLILLCCDAHGFSYVQASIGQDESQEYSQTGPLKSVANGSPWNPEISTSHQTIRDSCPWPYFRIATHCLHVRYLFYDNGNHGWEVARKYCQSLDGDLAWFEDKDLPLIIDYLNVAYYRRCFVGARRHDSTSDFEWVNGQKLPDTSSPLWDYTENADWNCVSLSNNNSYKLSNQDCMADKKTVGSFVCRLTQVA